MIYMGFRKLAADVSYHGFWFAVGFVVGTAAWELFVR